MIFRRRLLPILAAFAATATGAFGQSEISDVLPKHPIPYRQLTHPVHKPKPAPKPTAEAAPPGTPAVAPAAPLLSPKPTLGVAPPPKATPLPAARPVTAQPATSSPPAAIGAAPTLEPPRPPVTPPAPPTASNVVKPVQALSSGPAPAALVVPMAGPRLSPGQALSAPELQAFIDGQVSRAMAADHIVGVAVAVVQNGQLVIEKGYGAAKASPARPMDPRTTLVRLGSASQIFTWLAVLRAVEDGRLDLNAPVNSYLSEDLKLPDEGFDRPVLLRHLMSHTAGFEDRALGRRYVRDPRDLAALDDGLERLRPRRVRPPGLLSIPSDYGAALAGAAVAKAENLPFDQLIETEFLKPLGLAHTSFREPYPSANGLPAPLDATLAANLGDGFRWTAQGVEVQPFAYGQSLAPAIAASTTADDMARLMIALLNNGRMGDAIIYGPKAAALLRSPLQRAIPEMDGWAHGMALQTLPNGAKALTDIGSNLTFHANLTLVPAANLGIFVIANTDTGGGLTSALPGAVVQRFYGGQLSNAAAPSGNGDYKGTYLSAKRAYHGLEGFVDRLTLSSTIDTDAVGGLVLSDHRTAKVFVPTGVDDLFRSLDGTSLFAPTTNGRSNIYVLGAGGAAERVGGVHKRSVLAFWAAATAFTVFASFAGLFIRDRVDPRETRRQTEANAVQIIGCLAWCVAFGAFGLFLKEDLSPANLMFDWPNRWLLIASWSALLAGLLALAMVAQLPGAWREERRIHGWSVWRKLRHTAAVGVFLVFTAILAAWGALEPWSS